MRIVSSDVSKRRVENIISTARSVSVAIGSSAHVSVTGLRSEALSMESVLAMPAIHDQSTRFAVLRLVGVLAPLRDLLAAVTHQAFYHQGYSNPPVPLMGEFLDWIWDDRKYVLRKKRWP